MEDAGDPKRNLSEFTFYDKFRCLDDHKQFPTFSST